jgi:hypothetical protein
MNGGVNDKGEEDANDDEEGGRIEAGVMMKKGGREGKEGAFRITR